MSTEQDGVPNLSGTWKTQWAGLVTTLELNHVAVDYVIGTYLSEAQGKQYFAGAIAGEMKDLTIMGRWTDAKTTGRFVLEFSQDGKSFNGTWGNTVMSDADGGAWTGRKL